MARHWRFHCGGFQNEWTYSAQEIRGWMRGVRYEGRLHVTLNAQDSPEELRFDIAFLGGAFPSSATPSRYEHPVSTDIAFCTPGKECEKVLP